MSASRKASLPNSATKCSSDRSVSRVESRTSQTPSTPWAGVGPEAGMRDEEEKGEEEQISAMGVE